MLPLQTSHKVTMIFKDGSKQEIPFFASDWKDVLNVVGTLVNNEIVNNLRSPISVAADLM